MQVVYRLDVTACIAVVGQPPAIHTGDGTQVEWDVREGLLKAVRLTISKIPLERDAESSTIRTLTPGIEQKAFQAASFIANCVRFQTGFEAFDPYVVIGHSPDVSPETTEEEQEFKRARGQTRSTSAKQAVALTEPFNPSVYASHETHPDALASYADGLRAESPFLKYEQFYKVIEYFFEGEQKGKREVDDNEVDAYVSNANPILAATIGNFADLHDLRIRAIHMKPQAKRLKDKTHLSPNSFQHIQEIVMALPKLQDLARLLLKNPPRNTG